MNYLIVVVLTIFSGLFSGLTLGLMSLDPHELKRKIKLGDKDARRVYAIRKRGNLLLAVLLTGNTLVNATLSVFLGTIATGAMAIVVSSAIILILGEITPQAIFARNGLKLGAPFAWFVRGLSYILWPIVTPIAWVMDKTLGSELPTVYTREELEMIIEEHEDSPHSDLGENEEGIIKGALTYGKKTLSEVYTPLTQVLYFMEHDLLDEEALDEIGNSGFSRIPIFKDDFEGTAGIVYVKSLLGRMCDGTHRMAEVLDREVYTLKETMQLSEALQFMQAKRKHLYIIENEFGVLLGIVTLEDILEEILSFEIVDESDEHVDLRDVARSESSNT